MLAASPRHLDSPAALRQLADRWHSSGMSIGLVPTMGALHRGHRSLMQRARGECDRVVVSIFVNPAQFRAGEDLERYPRPVTADLCACAEEGVDAVLVPAVEAMYPRGFALTVAVAGALTAGLEEASRPGHFAGVALVVAKLLVCSRADRIYMGQKDAQQCAVVRRLATDLDTGTEVVVCPTVRDPDGLALSSRNAYLTDEQRSQALAIPRGLAAAAAAVAAGERDAGRLRDVVLAELAASSGLAVEYVEVVDPLTFAPVTEVSEGARIQVAGRIGATRLIDTLCPGLDELPAVPARVEAAPAGTWAAGADRSGACSASS